MVLIWMALVVIHQVIIDILLHFPQAHVSHNREPFRFKTSELSFYRGVIPAVTTKTHALEYAITTQPLPKYLAAILATLDVIKKSSRYFVLFINRF